MDRPTISLHGMTKDYGRGRGIFGVTLDVAQGQTVGFLGANGAGKTVTMRTLMGFIRPDSGTAAINGLDCFRDRARIQASLGYLPGEVACPGRMTGIEFLRFMADLNATGRRGDTRSRMDELVDRFDLDPSARISRMSKGTKQKVAIVAAFMGAPDVLLLDEPTSGLDPLMQERFVELVGEEHRRGATILLSSHMFPEIERTCDRVAFIRAGRVAGIEDMTAVRAARMRTFTLTFADADECARYRGVHRGMLVGVGTGDGLDCGQGTGAAPAAAMASAAAATHNAQDARAAGGARNASEIHACSLEVRVVGAVDAFVKDLAGYRLADIASHEQSLEEIFLHLYGQRTPYGAPEPTESVSPTHARTAGKETAR